MKLRFLLPVAASALLFGCASPSYNYVPEATDISEPPLNTVVTAYVGDAMVRQGRFTEHDAIYLFEPIKIGGLGHYTLSTGYYIKQGEDEKASYYLPPGGPKSGSVTKGALTDPFKIIKVDKRSNKICGVSILNAQVCSSKGNFEERKFSVATSDSFQQTLLYSGRNGDKINVGYREFSNNLARPAFNNDVEYDLSESNTIGYKGCRIEVIEATNELIKYKVIRNFNDAQQE